MSINGEFVFTIADSNELDVNFNSTFSPVKITPKGKKIALGRVTPKNIWSYFLKFSNEEDFVVKLNIFVNQLLSEKNYIEAIKKKYENVNINIYIRSDYAQIGYSMPREIVEKLAHTELEVYFHILSFGMVEK